MKRRLHIVVTPEDERKLQRKHDFSHFARGWWLGALMGAMLGGWGGWLFARMVTEVAVRGACP